MQQKTEKIFFYFEIIAFELIVLALAFTERECFSSGVNRLTNSLKISDTTKREFSKLISFRRDEKIWKKILPSTFKQSFGPFNMLIVHKFSGTPPFKHLSNPTLSSL